MLLSAIVVDSIGSVNPIMHWMFHPTIADEFFEDGLTTESGRFDALVFNRDLKMIANWLC